nr:unnamed protein product [Spirometra erinaceieuropaei]
MSPIPTSSIIPTSTSATKTTATTPTAITCENIPDAPSATALAIIASVINSVYSTPTHHRCYRACPGPAYQCQEFRHMPIGPHALARRIGFFGHESGILRSIDK